MEHPDSEITAVILIVPRNLTVPLHLQADTAPLLQLLRTLKDDHDQPMLTEEEAQQMAEVIGYFGGATVPAEWLVPPAAMAEAKTWDQLIAEQWLPVLPGA